MLIFIQSCRCLRVHVRKIKRQRIQGQTETHFAQRRIRFHQPDFEQLRKQRLRYLIAQAGYLLEVGAC